MVLVRSVVDLIVRLPREYATAMPPKTSESVGSSRVDSTFKPQNRVRIPFSERAFTALDTLSRDIQHGLRNVRRRPLWSAAAIFTLAIGIGLNAAVYSVVDWVLLRPLPYPAAQELVRVYSAGTGEPARLENLTYAEYQTLSRAASLRASIAFSVTTRVIAATGIEPSHVVVARVAGDLFATLGSFPQFGRAFHHPEIVSGAPIAVVSDGLWRRRFSNDPDIVGRPITIDGRPHTVVGVMPAGLQYPNDADLWRPLTAGEREDDDRDYIMVARMAGGATAAQSSLELDTLARGVSSSRRTAWAEDMQHTQVKDVRRALTALMASAALLLLIACANVAALIGSRGSERAAEMALRGALGASRARLIRQLLIETLLLATAGGITGLLLGRWALDVLVAAAPAEIPRLNEVTLDARVLVVGIATTLLVGLTVGIVPAFRASRLDLRTNLDAASARASTRSTTGRAVLVAVQAALAVVLTVGAALLARTLHHLVTIDHGFTAERLLAVGLDLRTVTGDERELFRQLITIATGMPHVRSAAVAFGLPTHVRGIRIRVRIAAGNVEPVTAIVRPVTPRYFETAGIRLLEGRDFSLDDREHAPRVAIVNRAFVDAVLGGRNAVGERVTVDDDDNTRSVIGIVGNITPAGEPDRPAVYFPVQQWRIGGGHLLVRTIEDPGVVVSMLAARIREVVPGVPLDHIRELSEALASGRSVPRFNTQIAGAFAGLALLLAALGIYGLTTGEVADRWRELGVRLALGASQGSAMWSVMRPGVAALAAGTTAGIASALGAGRWLATLLRGVDAADPPTLVIVPLLLIVIGVLAASVAAMRILRVDPAESLRRLA